MTSTRTLSELGELTGELVLKLSTEQAEYQDNLADNEMAFDVVFMAPETQPLATDDDRDDFGLTDDDVVDNAWGSPAPFPYVVKDDDTQVVKFGSDWFGLSYRFKNKETSNRDTATGVDLGEHYDTDNYAKAMILKTEYDLFSAKGNALFGADTGTDKSKAEANVYILGYKIIGASFNKSYCETSGSITKCPVFDGFGENEQRKPEKGKPKRESTATSKSYSLRFLAGPIPFMIKAEMGIDLGVDVLGFLSSTVPTLGTTTAWSLRLGRICRCRLLSLVGSRFWLPGLGLRVSWCLRELPLFLP